jgi:hypothetical protein
VLRSLCSDPQIDLQRFGMPGLPIVARLDVSVCEPTMAQLFWTTRLRGFCERNSDRIQLAPGRCVGYFSIPRHARGPLRFDPATSAIDITLHSLEFRVTE